MATMLLNEFTFISAITNMQTKANSIDDSISYWEGAGEQSKVLDEYGEMFAQIENIMGSYKLIINNDISALRQTSQLLTSLDAILKKSFDTK